jgi:hypothetical protein
MVGSSKQKTFLKKLYHMNPIEVRYLTQVIHWN